LAKFGIFFRERGLQMNQAIHSIIKKIPIDYLKKLNKNLKGKKRDMEIQLMERLETDVDLRSKIENYYSEMELGGRKHFFLWENQFTEEQKVEIKEHVKNFTPRNQIDIFDEITKLPELGEIMVFQMTDFGQCFHFRTIKEVEELINQQIINKRVVKEYVFTPIHHISFVNCRTDDGIILVGIDTYFRVFPSAKAIQEYATEIMQRIISHSSKNHIIEPEVINKLIREDNFIVTKIKGSLTIDEGTFKKQEKQKKKILQELINHTYRISDVKAMNSDIDIFSHPMFDAARKRAMDMGEEIVVSYAEGYWFTDASGNIKVFRVAFDAENSSIQTFSGAISEEEVNYVISRCLKCAGKEI